MREVGTNAWVSDLRIWQIDTPTQFVVAKAPTERKAFLPNYGNLKRNSPARHRGLARRAKICYTIQLR